jgi:hypothetical protein
MSYGKNIGPRIAAHLDVYLRTLIYGGHAIAAAQSLDPIKVIPRSASSVPMHYDDLAVIGMTKTSKQRRGKSSGFPIATMPSSKWP